MVKMADTNCIDIDQILNDWAVGRLGGGFAVEKFDMSNVKCVETGIIYHQSSEDWFHTDIIREEVFDNNDTLPITFNFQERIEFSSHVEWAITKGFKSSLLLPRPKLSVEFPVGRDDSKPLSVTFTNLFPEGKSQKASETAVWNLNNNIAVKPHSSSRACAQVRTCKLNNVPFVADFCLSGIVKVVGHKKRKGWKKQELTAGIDAAFKDNPHFRIVQCENVDSYNPSKIVFCKVEGTCSGEVAFDANIKLAELETLV